MSTALVFFVYMIAAAVFIRAINPLSTSRWFTAFIAMTVMLVTYSYIARALA